jgi:azurin
MTKQPAKLLSTILTLAMFVLAGCGGGGGQEQTQETDAQKEQEQQAQQDQTADQGGDGDKLSEMDKQMEGMEEEEPAAAGETAEVTLEALGNTMAEMRYDKDQVSVPAGSQVKLTLVNKGENQAMMHNVVIAKEGSGQEVATAGIKAGKEKEYVDKSMDAVIAATKMSGPGETVELTFDAPEPGTYTFLCTYPGHYPKMKGKFIVE